MALSFVWVKPQNTNLYRVTTVPEKWGKKSKNANRWKDGVDSRKRQALTHSGLKHFRLNA